MLVETYAGMRSNMTTKFTQFNCRITTFFTFMRFFQRMSEDQHQIQLLDQSIDTYL